MKRKYKKYTKSMGIFNGKKFFIKETKRKKN